MHNFRFFESHPWRGVVAIAALLLTGLAQAGPISPLYLVGHNKITVLQGNNQINTWVTRADDEFSIAVDSTVRTYAQNAQGVGTDPGLGSEYLLDGTPTGVTYTNTAGCCFRDGATDGTYNYATDSRGNVYQFNSDWTNPQLYDFFPGLEGFERGITYDGVTDGFWLSSHDNGLGHDNGQVLIINAFRPNTNPHSFINDFFVFRPPTVPRRSHPALAFDPIDRTLWIAWNAAAGAGSTAILEQYSTEQTGLIPRRFPLSSLQINDYITATEFVLRPGAVVGDPRGRVPEPTSVVLFITGLLGMNLVRRKSWRGAVRLP